MSFALFVRNQLKEKIQEKLKNKINEKLLLVQSTVVPLTPVSKSRKGHTGGLLRKNWGVIPAAIYGDLVYGYLYNNTHYASHVNFGHRTRLGTGKKKSKANGKKFVEGQHFLERALEQAGLNPSAINKNYKGGKR
ncbi:MAG: hypothetical protein CR959_00310 [Fusobacteriales bacterium]|nr:MAG: hypothetical protein CR959_00310 [Fusobacteriales bacterium]